MVNSQGFAEKCLFVLSLDLKSSAQLPPDAQYKAKILFERSSSQAWGYNMWGDSLLAIYKNAGDVLEAVNFLQSGLKIISSILKNNATRKKEKLPLARAWCFTMAQWNALRNLTRDSTLSGLQVR